MKQHPLQRQIVSLKQELVRTKHELGQQILELDKTAKLLIRRDLELTAANERLSELDKIKSEFISIVAHQLRTPLSAIKWVAKMLLDGDAGKLSSEQNLLLRKAYESNERLIHLINDLLDVDRIETGRLKYSFYPIYLEDLLDNIILDFSNIAKEKGVRLILRKNKKKMPSVSVDPMRMRQVFQNIIDNSIKYTSSGGRIWVSIHHDDAKAEVRMKDTGVGIPEKQQKHIFSRFFRGNNVLKLDTEGTGMGLYIAKKIIENHEGNIRFTSMENKGTTFFVTLPLTRAPEHIDR